MASSILVALVLSAPTDLPLAPIEVGLGEVVHKEVTFIGFSADEAVAAWDLAVRRRHANALFEDSFRVVRLVDSSNKRVLATFRASKAIRRNRRGRKVQVSERDFSGANQEWASAGPYSEWASIRRSARFSYEQVPISVGNMRITTDPYARFGARFKKGAVFMRNRDGGELGFRPYLRTGDGQWIPLGHFREEGFSNKDIRAKLSVFRSESGRTVAVVNQFTVRQEGLEWATPQGTLINVPGPAKRPELAAFPTVHNAYLVSKYDRLQLANQLHRSAMVPTFSALQGGP